MVYGDCICIFSMKTPRLLIKYLTFMKKITLKVSMAILCAFCFTGNAQNKTNLAQTQFTQLQSPNLDFGLIKTGMIPVDGKTYAGRSNTDIIRSILKLSGDHSFSKSEKKPIQDKLGFTHQRMDHYYKGVKVEFSEVILHYNQKGDPYMINGAYFNVDNIALTPSLAASTSLDMAVEALGVETPMWEDETTSAFANYSKPEGELVILADFEDASIARLAWKFDVFASGKPLRDMVYMDANTGNVLFRNPIVKHAYNFGHDGAERTATEIAYVPNQQEAKLMEGSTGFMAAGDADTKYSGNNQQVETIQQSGLYELLSVPDGITIRTYDANNAPANSTTGITVINDPNNNNDWTSTEFTGKAQGELDAHWGAEEVYDYWNTVHGRSSYDDAGASIFSLVHVQTNFDNAFWNGAWMSYGDGSSNGNEGNGIFDILTSLDVCAHEIGHAVVSNTSNLIYQRESGGLNEGFADIWGASVEFRSKGNGNDMAPNAEVWLIGDEIDRRTGSAALRSMSNPKLLGQPDTYQGTNWVAATVAEGCVTPDQNNNDQCGVHTNSGVLNFWYYLTVAGGSGTNDNGDNYNVTGIGMAKAELIAERTQSVYLSAFSDFADARAAAIQSARDLYGACSQEEETVAEAFYAVGVGSRYGSQTAPVAGVQTITSYSDDFEDGFGWSSNDADADGNDWRPGISGITATGITGLFNASETDLTVLGGTGTANPNNYYISPKIFIPEGTTNVEFRYGIYGYQAAHHYTTYWTTDATSDAAILAGVQLEDRDALANTGQFRTINNTSISGEAGYFVIRHHSSNGDAGLLLFDNLTVTSTAERGVQTTVNSGSTEDSLPVTGAGTDYASDTATTNVIADITNNNSFNYGCTTVAVSRAGTSGQPYNGSVAPNLVMDKTFDITPTNINGSGDVSVKFYFTAAEVAGWESATGLSRTDLRVIRNDGNGNSETSPITIGAFGSNVTFTASFSDLNGTYAFGTENAIKCTNTRTYNGAWDVAPGTNSHVLFTSDYDTNNGNIDACNCTVNSLQTVTVRSGDYMNITNDITVNGTLLVEHQGSVVQVDSDAAVVNNGAINVEVTTPLLQTRDFMIMGSPMTAETRTNVFTDAFLVLKFNPTNFIPNVDVPAGGTNFADDNGDFYSTYNSTINPGEGYVVRPQSSYTDPANTTYDMTYELGTLNNGDISYTFSNNGSLVNPNGTPNVVANPYASAISASAFMTANSVSEVYFWEHITPPSSSLPGAGSMNFSMDDISYYNGSMGVPAANDPGTSTAPNGVISTGQGFAVRTSGAAGTTGTMTFTNAMRLTSGNNTLRRPIEIEKLTLNVRNDEFGVGSYTGIAFNPAASVGLDENLDTQRLATVVSLYTHLEDGSEQFGIQSHGLFDSGVKIPMGFSTQVDAQLEYRISKSDIEGSNLSEATVYLIDNYTGTITNLNDGDYSFSSGKGVFDGRFTVQFEGAILDTEDAILETVSVFPNPTTNVLNIASPRTDINKVEVYDVRGRMVSSSEYNFSKTVQFDLSQLDAAMYFVTISTESGSITKKVVKN